MTKKVAPPTLEELQRWMRWVITEPHGVDTALEKSSAGEIKTEPMPRLLGSITEAPPLSRTRRLDIYAEGYYSRLYDCLAEDFETVLRAVGEEHFRRMVSGYLLENPSRTYDLAKLGARFPEFLASYRLSDELPYLADLAALEWACVRAFYAPDAPEFDRAKLQGVLPVAWGGARLALDPSVSLVHSDWAVDDMWRDENTPAELGERWLLVLRREFGSRVERLEPLQYQVLELIQEGHSLGAVCEKIESKLDIDADPPPLMDWFQGWMESGVIRDVVFA